MMFACPLPAATCVVFHPQNDNLLAIGMLDASIHIYDVRLNNVMKKLTGHQKRVTRLAFSIDKRVLVSSGADAELCVWKIENWEKIASKLLKIPHGRTSNPLAETRVLFNFDETHMLVIHETQIAILDPLTLGSVMQWILPHEASGSIRDAVFSCDGQSIFVSIDDGSVGVFTAKHLRLKCRHTCHLTPGKYRLS